MKRIILLLLSIVLCIGLVAGCGGEPEAQNTAEPTATATPETVATATPENSPAATPSVSAPVASGALSGKQDLMLVSSIAFKGAEMLENTQNEDGTYKERLLVDGLVTIGYERLLPAQAGEAGVKAAIEELETNPQGLQIAADDDLTDNISYSVWKAEYTVGSNEDTQSCIDYYIQTDDWDFRFHVAIPIDHYEEYEDAVDGWADALRVEQMG